MEGKSGSTGPLAAHLSTTTASAPQQGGGGGGRDAALGPAVELGKDDDRGDRGDGDAVAGHHFLPPGAVFPPPLSETAGGVAADVAGGSAVGVSLNEVLEEEARGEIERMPRLARIVSLLIQISGINETEEGVVPQLLEYAHRHIAKTLACAHMISEHRGSNSINVADLRIASRNRSLQSTSIYPDRHVLFDIAEKINSPPLSIIHSDRKIRLPPPEYLLTNANYIVETVSKKNKIPRPSSVKLGNSK